MTLSHETASVRKPLTSERAVTAPLAAMAAGLVVVLMALAVTSWIAAGRLTTETIQGAPSYADPYREFVEAPAVGAPSFVDPYREFVQAPTIQPQEAELDTSIRRILLQDDQAAVDGSGLRLAPQPAEGMTDGRNQRFVHAD